MLSITRAQRAVVLVATLISVYIRPAHAGAQQSSKDALVARFYPQWLADDSEDDFKAGGPPPFRAMASVDADLDGTGRASYIVAAFTNGFSGAVTVLAKQGTSAVQVAAPQFPMMLGIQPHVTLLDVDGDGRPEIEVSFSGATGLNADWLLRWEDGTLKSIGPTEVDDNGDVGTLLMDALFIDLDGDGILEIVNTPDEPQPGEPLEYEVFSLAGGHYAQTRTFTFFDTFARPAKPSTATTGREDQNSQPEVIDRDFVVGGVTGPYELAIVNGEPSGHRVTSAEIWVNGVEVANPEVLGGNRRIVKVPIAVKASNTIHVVLRGPRDTWLTIGVSSVAAGK